METCSPVSQVGPRDTGDLKVWLPEQQWEPGLLQTWWKTVSATSVCHLGTARSTHTGETGKGSGPHQPQPAHQVTKVDGVQILQPTLPTLPALLTLGPHGNAGPEAGPVLIPGISSARERVLSSLCVQDRG